MKALLIAEKRSVAADIEAAYNKAKGDIPYDIDFTYAAGHILELKSPDEYREDWGKPWKADVLPMIPPNWEFNVTNKKIYDTIKTMYDNGGYDVIINAGDAGREGQLIQDLIYDAIGVNIPILRYWADDNTEKTIIKTLKKLVPNEEYKNLSDAAHLRLYLDWLIGMNFSRSATLSLDRLCRLGRVMTPTLKMVCDREEEIENFKPVPFFEVKGKLESGNDTYTGLIFTNIKDAPTPYAFPNEKDANSLASFLNGKTGVITKVENEGKTVFAPTLFNLTDLQKECSSKLKFTPKKTLDIAQSLYEKGFMTYPRTESKCVTKEQAKELPDLLNKLKGLSAPFDFARAVIDSLAKEDMERALSSKKYVDNKKVHDHPALLPTTKLPSGLTPDETLVYDTVLRRFLAIFMPPHTYTQTTILSSVSEKGKTFDFKSVGKVINNNGWKSLYKPDKKDDDTPILPSLSEGDPFTVKETKVLSKQTNPPSRYTNATLLTAMETCGKKLDDEEYEKVLMECAGLGTPATRADILDKLFSDRYLVSDKSYIRPTDEGRDLIKALGNSLITSPELTAKFEKYLKSVETGEISYDNFYEIMEKYIHQGTLTLSKLERIGPFMRPIGKCPLCGGDFVELSNYYACVNRFKKDDTTCPVIIPKVFGKRPITKKDITTLIKGEKTEKKSFIWGNGKKSSSSLILGWSEREVDGKKVKSYGLCFPAEKDKYEEVGICPNCGGRILKGKGYFCENWTKKGSNGEDHLCDFVMPGKVGVTEISADLFKEILEHGETKNEVKVKIKKKDGSTVQMTGKLIFDMEKHWIALKPFEPKPVCSCPVCNAGTIMETMYSYVCQNTLNDAGCDFKVNKRFSSALITHDELKKMIPLGKKIHKTNLISSKGKPYESDLWIKRDSKYGYVITFKD